MEYEYELEQCGTGKGKKKTVKASSTKTAPVEVVPERPKRLTDSLREAVAEADEIAAGLDRIGATTQSNKAAIGEMLQLAGGSTRRTNDGATVSVEVLPPKERKSLTAQLRDASKELDDIQAGLDRMGNLQAQLVQNTVKISESAKKLGMI